MSTRGISKAMRKLSPERNTSASTTLEELVQQQLQHFGIDADDEFGQRMSRIARRLYETQDDLEQLWISTLKSIATLDHPERIVRFNAKKFLSFQLAKLLDTLQHSFRRGYQSLNFNQSTLTSKGPYPVFDNITAIFSATPVIARTATYIYACAEWIEDAFRGEELMLEIYSRLLNPTSISLANYVVDLEAGKYADQYFAWNFNSGMAAIDGVLTHVLGRDDILITSRHIYGGAYQLIHDWFAKPGNLEIAVELFDGYEAVDFELCWRKVQKIHDSRLKQGRRAYVYLESPCNPHGYVLDVPGICRFAHQHDLRVVLDATIGTPFLHRSIQREDDAERPDFVVHSYTKDMTGSGSAIAGCVIGRNEDMFIPKGQSVGEKSWSDTLFWNVYYVKGAFLNADAAFEVIQGMRTLSERLLRKCINTRILATVFDSHPQIQVHCNALAGNANSQLCRRHQFLGLPAPLFTIDMATIPRPCFQRFFDSLSPAFGHMISLGQSNTIVSCPALTTHSELDDDALAAAGMSPTTIRFAVGDEEPIDLIRHFIAAAKRLINVEVPGFSEGFLDWDGIKTVARDCYLETHRRYIDEQLKHTSVQ